MKAISLHSVVPVRSEARESAEQCTQMLFGELCTILDSQPSEINPQLPQWYHIRLDTDGQEGWADAKMISPMKSEEYASYSADYAHAAVVVMPMAYAVSENNGQTIPLTAGTRLTKYDETGRFEVLGVGFRIDPSMVARHPLELNPQNLLQAVRFFLNVPYLWGGKNAMGLDCSGFTQVVMSLFGRQLLRNASEQVTQGQPVPDLQHAQAGDLVFFDHNDGRISHVGIILHTASADLSIIHCSGRVKVERLDETGIFSVERADKDHPEGLYTHHLVAIRRM